MAATTRDAGRSAEDAVARWLEARGWRVIARNHAAPRGEVDLVCDDHGTLCFVEVRSRTSAAFGSPALTVDGRKRRRIVAAATDWAVRNGGLDRAIRFDVVAVDLSGGAPRFELFEGAFDAAGRSL
jgi:putative endonuclease